MDHKYLLGTEAFSVTPSNTTTYYHGIVPYVGTGGDITVVPTDSPNTTVTFKNFASGSFLSLRCTKVMATGTTAADIVGVR